MRLVCVLFTFENNTGRTYGPTDGPTDRRTDTTSYRDATAHLKTPSVQPKSGPEKKEGDGAEESEPPEHDQCLLYGTGFRFQSYE